MPTGPVQLSVKVAAPSAARPRRATVTRRARTTQSRSIWIVCVSVVVVGFIVAAVIFSSTPNASRIEPWGSRVYPPHEATLDFNSWFLIRRGDSKQRVLSLLGQPNLTSDEMRIAEADIEKRLAAMGKPMRHINDTRPQNEDQWMYLYEGYPDTAFVIFRDNQVESRTTAPSRS
jgi:hypothetical protein